jgi:hypothetical protein
MAVRAGCALAAVAVAALFLQLAYAGGDVKAVATPAKTAGLSGADLYALNCNRCHAERYPKEFQASQWTTIMLHMRVRANIPASQAKEILKYLQEQSGN